MSLKLIIALLPGVLLLSAAHAALAADFGSSSWTYTDSRPGAAEAESRRPAGGPHSGTAGAVYAATGKSCRICHASRRPGGTFKLTTADSAEDACVYCHVDDSRHAGSRAYTGKEGIYPVNGHTIGAGPEIPSSSVRQWLEPFTAAADAEETSPSRTVRIRRYDPRRLKLFAYTGEGADGTTGGGSGLVRYGPTPLGCLSCHQPHNAPDLVWKPPGAPDGYKLLKASPSGSLLTGDSRYDPLTYTGPIEPGQLEPGAAVGVPEQDFGPANTGHNLGKDGSQADSQTASGIFTTWTQWKGATETLSPGALSVWCADCHNLQMAANERPDANRSTMHTDRTHTAGTDFTPCYACHRANGDGGRIGGNTHNWEATAAPENISDADCDRCHYRAGKYALDNPTNDFPHGGAPTSAKLLPDWYNAGGGEALDQVCKYCHDNVGSDM